jgi:hypothetical protein
MGMTSKSALYALAVVVLMGSMAVAALADDHGMNMYGPAESSVSAQPEQGVEQLEAGGEIREPVETGAVPDRSIRSSELGSGAVGDVPTAEYGGQTFRLGIDDGS